MRVLSKRLNDKAELSERSPKGVGSLRCPLTFLPLLLRVRECTLDDFSFLADRFVGTWPQETGERCGAAREAWLVCVAGRGGGLSDGTLPLPRACDPFSKG